MKLVSSRERYRCSILRVTEDHAIEPGGVEIRRVVVRHGASAVMMPVDAKGRVLLVRQYRLPAGRALWELPAGRADPGESPLAAARRELEEETGYRARHWKKLVAFYPSPGFLTEKMTIFLATGLIAGLARPMEDERIECRWFTRRELDARIRAGKIIDGKTLVGLMLERRLR